MRIRYSIIDINTNLCFVDELCTMEDAIRIREQAKKEYPDNLWYILVSVDGVYSL
jgi:hypothetical protein